MQRVMAPAWVKPADRLILAVRQAGREGLNGRQVHKVFHGKADADSIQAAVDLLVRMGKIRHLEVLTAGRPARMLFAAGITPS